MKNHPHTLILGFGIIISAVLVLLSAACMPTQPIPSSANIEPAHLPVQDDGEEAAVEEPPENEEEASSSDANENPVAEEDGAGEQVSNPSLTDTDEEEALEAEDPVTDEGGAIEDIECILSTDLSPLTQADIKKEQHAGKENFSGRTITGTLDSINLSGTDFSCASFFGITLTNVTLTETNLSGAILINTELVSVTMKKAILAGADFTGADGLTSAHLESANSDLSGIVLSGQDLSGINLSEFDLSHAKFISSTMDRANFAEAKLTNTQLISATLKSSNFTNAILYGADFQLAQLNQANFTGAYIGCKLLVPEGVSSTEALGAISTALINVKEALKKIIMAEEPEANQKDKAQNAIIYAREAREGVAIMLLFAAKIPTKDAASQTTATNSIKEGLKAAYDAQEKAKASAAAANIIPPYFSPLDFLDEFDFELVCEQKYPAAEMPSRRTNFSYATLTDAIFYNADVRHVDFTRAILRNTKFNTPGYAVTVRNALSETSPNAANLQGADFKWADLTGACLSGADLSGANLRQSLLGHVELDGTKLLGADLSQAYVSPFAVEMAICDEKTTLPFNFDAISAYTCIQNNTKSK